MELDADECGRWGAVHTGIVAAMMFLLLFPVSASEERTGGHLVDFVKDLR